MLKSKIKRVAAPFGRRRDRPLDELGDTNLPVIQMHYQPIVEYATDTLVVGHEALVRSQAHSSVAELFKAVGACHLNRFDAKCRRSAIDDYSSDKSLFVNISAGALADYLYGIEDTIAYAGEHGFPYSRLVFEITEDDHHDTFRFLRNSIDEARKLGVRFAVDDCGTGYSNLETIIALRPDILKISGTIVRNIHLDTTRQAIVDGLVTTAEKLKSMLIAEGVEREIEALCLKDLGVSVMQGYYFGYPEPFGRAD